MSARLASGVSAAALIRRVNAAGGSAMVLARGDQMAGGILILALDRGQNPRFFERGMGPSGGIELIATGPRDLENDADTVSYWQKRRCSDPDLWVIEVDIAEAERFAAETILPG